MAKEMELSAIQHNEQDRIKDGTFAFLDEYRGRRVNQYTGARGGRHYEVEGYQFDFSSVTSVTGIVNKFGIPDYYKRKGIEKAISVMAQPGAQERLALSATLKNDRARKHKNNTWQTELYEEAKSGPQDAMDIAANFGIEAHALIEERRKCAAAGMNAHISKPVDSRELVSKLNSYIRPNAPTATPIEPLISDNTDDQSDKDQAPKEASTDMEDASTPSEPSSEQIAADKDTDYYNLEEVKNRLMLPDDVLISLIVRFVDGYGDIANNIAALVEDDKFVEAAELAHTSKGVSGSLGATMLYEKCTAIDDMLKDQRIDDVRAEMAGFKTIANRTIAVMKAAIAKHESA